MQIFRIEQIKLHINIDLAILRATINSYKNFNVVNKTVERKKRFLC